MDSQPIITPPKPEQQILSIQMLVEKPSGRRVDAATNVVTGAVQFQGYAQLQVIHDGQPGTIPIQFSIPAATVQEAFDHFDAAVESAKEHAIAELTKPRIVTAPANAAAAMAGKPPWQPKIAR